jgi:hypothetical protein
MIQGIILNVDYNTVPCPVWVQGLVDTYANKL